MKRITHSLIAVLLISSGANAATEIDGKAIEIVDGWEFSGDIRAGWLQYDYDNKPKGIDANGNIEASYPDRNLGHVDSKGIYTTPKLSISSPKSSRIQAKVTLAGATDFGINDEKYESRNYVFDPSDRKSFLILQEGYLQYVDKEHKALAGREEITTPMIDADDWYMLANSFELAYYVNSSLENTDITAGYFGSMSGVWDSGANGTEFNSMSQASFIDGADKAVIGDKGVYFAAVNYNDNIHHNLQVWDYYADEMYNTIFMQYDYTNSAGILNYDFGLQFMNFKEVGYLATAGANTNIDYSLYSARFDGDFSNGIDFATGYAKFTDGEGQGATLGAFGGYPYFANGMIFHFFEAGSLQNAASYKAQLGYSFEKVGIENLWIGYRYTYFDLDPKYSKNLSDEEQNSMALNGVRVSYGGKIGSYFTATYEHVDLDKEPNSFSLRLICGYKF